MGGLEKRGDEGRDQFLQQTSGQKGGLKKKKVGCERGGWVGTVGGKEETT